jgi:hypothetical protein
MARISVCNRHAALVCLSRIRLSFNGTSGFLRPNQVRILSPCQLCNNSIATEYGPHEKDPDALPATLMIFEHGFFQDAGAVNSQMDIMQDAADLAKSIIFKRY